MKKVYENIDKKYAKVPCELIIEIKLVVPYNVALEQVLSMISIWDMRLIRVKHLSPKIKIAIKYEKFLKLFGDVALIIGKTYTLKGTEKFIKEFKLLDIIGNKKKNESRERKN